MSTLAKFESFTAGARRLMDEVAKEKGYDSDLLSFCQKMRLTHAEGEIIYKLVRYNRKRNPEDLLKIAAWAYLMWKEHEG